MSWVLGGVAICVVLVAAWWWLNRPLYHHCPDSNALEGFLGDLVSEKSPWPAMEVHLQRRHLLTYRRERGPSGMFDLTLEVARGSGEPLALGPISNANLNQAAARGRSALSSLGVERDTSLKIRYCGSMDPVVVARTRGTHSLPAA